MAISKIENASLATGVPGRSQLPAGTVLQVIQSVYSTSTSSSSTTFVDSGLTATITPTSTTSKILVLVSHPEIYKTNGNFQNSMKLNLCRNGSQVIQFNNAILWTGSALENQVSASFNYLDSPASSSAVTYKTQFANLVNQSNVQIQSNNTPSTITLMEIAA